VEQFESLLAPEDDLIDPETDDTSDSGDDGISQGTRIELLSKERQFELGNRWKHHQDRDALHELVMWHIPLADGMVAKFRGYGLPDQDLQQEAFLGLIKAAERFDPDREIRFGTYAKSWVKAAICAYIFKNWSIVTPPETMKFAFFSLKKRQAKLLQRTDRELTRAERIQLAKELRLSEADYARVEDRLAAADDSLNALTSHGDEDDGVEYGDRLPSLDQTPEEHVTEVRGRATSRQILARALMSLPKRERRIVYLRRVAGQSLQDVGDTLGLSRERIRQLEQESLATLQRHLRRQGQRFDELVV